MPWHPKVDRKNLNLDEITKAADNDVRCGASADAGACSHAITYAFLYSSLDYVPTKLGAGLGGDCVFIKLLNRVYLGLDSFVT